MQRSGFVSLTPSLIVVSVLAVLLFFLQQPGSLLSGSPVQAQQTGPFLSTAYYGTHNILLWHAQYQFLLRP